MNQISLGLMQCPVAALILVRAVLHVQFCRLRLLENAACSTGRNDLLQSLWSAAMRVTRHGNDSECEANAYEAACVRI